jgi:hypothetical protein
LLKRASKHELETHRRRPWSHKFVGVGDIQKAVPLKDAAVASFPTFGVNTSTYNHSTTRCHLNNTPESFMYTFLNYLLLTLATRHLPGDPWALHRDGHRSPPPSLIMHPHVIESYVI